MRRLIMTKIFTGILAAAGCSAPKGGASDAGDAAAGAAPEAAASCGASLPSSDQEWKERLDPEAYRVLRQGGTERAFTGALWDNDADGTYLCAGCGTPLFSSDTKFDSRTGWPSFTKPLEEGRVKAVVDHSFGMVRTEIRCATCDGHLGHVFEDGPLPTRTRYCMNSAALTFDGLEQPGSQTDKVVQQHAGDGGNAPAVPMGLESAVFAGGCFWCMVGPFQSIDGVREVLSGYTGGSEKQPSYQEVSRGLTGHTEAVRVLYDPTKVEFSQLVEAYWRSIDPTDVEGQFADRGAHYRPVLYVNSDEEQRVAEASRDALNASGRFDKPVVVPIERAQAFWVAEEEHHDCHRTSPTHYHMYRLGSGRGPFLERVWRDDGELKDSF